MYDLIIIGAGPAGISASLYAKRANINVLILYHGKSNIENASQVDNYYGFKSGISGEELYNNGIEQAKKLGIEVKDLEVIGIENLGGTYNVKTTDEVFNTSAIILATGNKKITPNIKGIKEFEGKGVSYCAICDAFFYKNKNVAVIGDGNFAISEANELSHVAETVTILTNGKQEKFTRAFENGKTEDLSREFENKTKEEFSIELENEIPKNLSRAFEIEKQEDISIEFDIKQERNIEQAENCKKAFKINTKKIKRIDGGTKVEKIEFEDGSSMRVDGVFVALGEAGAGDFAKTLGIMQNGNDIKVNEKMETNLKGFFACGNATGGLLQICKAVYEGAVAGLSAVDYIRNIK